MAENRHPSRRALQWVAETVKPGVRIKSVELLTGATSSVLHRIELEDNGRSLKLVLRQFNNREWLAEEPDLARHEAASLQKVCQADVPTPELVAVDETGEHCGVPTIVMTELAGRVELKPGDLDGWLHQLAEAILPIHSLEVGTFPWQYQPYNDLAQLEPPTWSSVPDLWARAIEIVQGPRPATPECFIHRDYHPVNVLWQNNQVSGIIDWPNACRGVGSFDVTWCRLNLIQLHGVAAADRFLNAYHSLAGPSFTHHPYWDLMGMIELLPGPPEVYPPWLHFGMRHLNKKLMCQRNDEYLASVMDRF
ncbi:MAG: aminoglycoside phosphotransferase family protein [Anaerolineae bacterium]|nr:aminoglycoside phosphotransferase family protein [Anaerolineae bacterium]